MNRYRIHVWIGGVCVSDSKARYGIDTINSVLVELGKARLTHRETKDLLIYGWFEDRAGSCRVEVS